MTDKVRTEGAMETSGKLHTVHSPHRGSADGRSKPRAPPSLLTKGLWCRYGPVRRSMHGIEGRKGRGTDGWPWSSSDLARHGCGISEPLGTFPLAGSCAGDTQARREGVGDDRRLPSRNSTDGPARTRHRDSITYNSVGANQAPPDTREGKAPQFHLRRLSIGRW